MHANDTYHANTVLTLYVIFALPQIDIQRGFFFYSYYSKYIYTMRNIPYSKPFITVLTPIYTLPMFRVPITQK